MIEHYAWLKLIHILSSTLLFGTGLGTAYYMWHADRTGDPTVVALVARQVVLADWLFTTPAVVIQPLTGFLMLEATGVSLSSPWITYSLVLYVLVGACWLPVVWIQHRVALNARHAVEQGAGLGSRHRHLMRYWYALGWPAFIGVLAIFYLMVFKSSGL